LATKILEIEDANIDPAVDENVDDAALVNAMPCTQVGPFFQGGFRMEIWPSMMSGASRVSCFTGAFAVRSRQRAVWESSVRRPVRGL
jgi:hypothetical protein